MRFFIIHPPPIHPRPPQSKSTQSDRDNFARFGITATKFFGVSMAKGLGRDHELAAGLWETGWYEARMVAALVDEPGRVTVGQMESPGGIRGSTRPR